MIKNKRFSNAINKVPQKVPPIWFMRQAGRYHSHYQGLRKKHSFVELCKEPELAAEVAMGPINDFDYDVAILFSDILFPLESLGLRLDYKPGPTFENLLTPDSLKNLDSSDKIVDDMNFQSKALSITRDALSESKSLVGFVGGPWTLLSYGTGIKNETNIDNLHKNEFYEKLLYDTLIPALYQIIEMQLKSSAEIVYMFDTNASQLQSNYFIGKYIEEIKQSIFSAFPNQVAYFCKENPILNNPKSNLKYQLAGMVYGENKGLETILPKLESGFLQGNFDPKNLLLPEKEFQFEVDNFIKIFRNLSDSERSGWVCSLSHGVLPKAREDNVRYFIEKVRSDFR